jgi:hypothetical protein
MTQESIDRIDRIENRVDHMEREVLQKIFDKLESLTIIVTKQSCPSPGACIGLSDKLQQAIHYNTSTNLRVERLELELIKLNQQKAWLLGCWSAIAFFAGILGSIGTILVSKIITK